MKCPADRSNLMQLEMIKSAKSTNERPGNLSYDQSQACKVATEGLAINSVYHPLCLLCVSFISTDGRTKK